VDHAQFVLVSRKGTISAGTKPIAVASDVATMGRPKRGKTNPLPSPRLLRIVHDQDPYERLLIDV
jgi:hypothetical protein